MIIPGSIKPDNFPRVLRIEPASSCNLRCSHCPTGTVDMPRGIMTDELFNKLCQQIKENIQDVKVVVLYHGGEPLLKKNFASMISTLKQIGVPFVKTVSNGMMLDEKKAMELIESGLDVIEFSLDGTSPDENNEIRVRSNYATVVGNIRLLLKLKKEMSKGPDVYISSTQFLTNDEITKSQVPEVCLPPEYLEKEFKDEVKTGTIKGFKTTYAMKWPRINIDPRLYTVLTDEKSESSNYCDHVYHTMTIRSDGDVVACCYDLTSEFVLGNVKSTSLKDLWHSHKYNSLRKSIEEQKFIKLCQGCNTVMPKAYLIKNTDQTV